VTELPRIEIRYQSEMPVSGSAHWEAGHWVITLNASEAAVRRRFSLMHEFKHVLDHTTQHYLYGDTTTDPAAAQRAERVADHFAACLLMPKRWVKSAWFNSHQNVGQLAARLQVSARALSVRLWHLGLGIETERCPRTRQLKPHSGRRTGYFRSTPLTGASA
jgi:Zn-dependent peptidase ImmA (M78 family)